MVKMEEIALTF